MPLVQETGGPRHRAGDPVTSQVAAELADLPGSQTVVIELLAMYGPQTAYELENRTWLASGSRIRTALVELEKRGVAERTGEYRKALRCMAQIWRLR